LNARNDWLSLCDAVPRGKRHEDPYRARKAAVMMARDCEITRRAVSESLKLYAIAADYRLTAPGAQAAISRALKRKARHIYDQAPKWGRGLVSLRWLRKNKDEVLTHL
jgi:hypothetical protein